MAGNLIRTHVYVDGFNLYYGAVKDTPYKWLDIDALIRLIFPQNQLDRIKYFTARLTPRPADPDKPVRQQTYIRALRTLPHLQVIYGQFLEGERMMLRAGSAKPQFVRVLTTEEKGSDVNIAAHMLMDGFKRAYEMAILVTNDSDLAEPVRMVTQELGLKVGVLNPHHGRASFHLNRHATLTRTLRSGALARCQFPPSLQDAQGVILKPASW